MSPLLPFNEDLCVRLTLTLVHFLWQGVAIALVVLLAGRALRRASATTRYLTLLAALLLMAACPPATFLLLPDSGRPR